ncbi:poly(glycerol-phosphate) alpha-glucosyltransferase [Staphylococcus pseudintermedius]|uniref:poly(glycerol-phosphate) alpha-glucosyltransferase n=1 Tax=Staphylococcus pseudintermedius TaxID=283734 RepID=UPI000BC819FA|nr:poly(glycerol-phosphate) alpha-glucosyltransferase [Staphylococcus pseudintermedius]EGQ0329622.1 poly(glycerol-phosphate) alpha-glucosyltransferase [Staphylococcus pseudintermedius]EGQ2773919.1 poly(glycerol-phosphate) alpha-glucosyltransferase [Staphylococcus pseudintermedius]EGQ2803728.1 poly(glycerol-phosphate) alpha-glucosyltransferase [Staphylococcus pseudintermedius]EGQ3096546.1 poly(glycerol-phosphate) alpha-glucosyltransferase [Staphylococcus pseudintermedius]EGQ3128744.1 poly(glyce
MEKNIAALIQKIDKNHPQSSKIIISLGNPNIKAYVKPIKNTNNLKSQIMKQIEKYKRNSAKYPEWIKIDVVTNEQKVNFNDVEQKLIETRRNYVDFGIVLDESWQVVFLPEEINANAFVRPSKQYKNSKEIAENNITHYLKKYKHLNKTFKIEAYQNKIVTTFQTTGYFIENKEIIELHAEGYMKGIRKIRNLTKEIDKLIETSTQYLQNEIQPNGKFTYGYFPHFDREINYYNVLRHSSTTYALTESLAYLNQDINVIKKALNYIIENHFYEKGDEAFIFDDTNSVNEIKLGQNASFIFAVCEYLRVNPNDDIYLKYAQKVARGILSMINMNNMETIHVLNYPDLSIKERFRIVYYDGEASLALLRLYQLDQNSNWLNTVEMLFEKFISKNYWKYHDHWLGYCTNELVKIVPKEEYFKFGIKNVVGHLDYIYQRETTFPTFLELLMATYHLIEAAKANGFEKLVEDMIDEEKFIKTIHKRADYQRTGYFYPEVAMYFKNPRRTLGSFFIKHHGYRVRIDDVEHYLSGYVQYQKVFKWMM